MGCYDHTHARLGWGQWHRGAIEEGTACSTLGMNGVLVRRGLQTGLYQGQIKEPIVLTVHRDTDAGLHQVFEDAPVAIQAI
ncbi:hypothetical protein KDAU_64900 [Dictyobacter aurantiacus]|uniref:Uncharacterized protein n=1 Tax=Dictyobacter aurantiacus TaxID=1936993 RepID=A0A401ZQL7_9CHLR|nr:hypothetical protein KDAU_64900 [Dictyobacter aurantiacus]